MSLKSAIQTAMTHALNHDGKDYDPSQIMGQNPYDYVTADMMRDLLIDVAHELSTDTPPATLNVDKMDLNKCMTSAEIDVETMIYLAIPPAS